MGDPRDICECGDYRSDHPNTGPCLYNKQIYPDLTHGFEDCVQFRLHKKAKDVEPQNFPSLHQVENQ